MKRPIERRKHKRFQPIAGLFVVLSSKAINLSQIKNMSMTEITLKLFKSKPIKMGQIIDISSRVILLLGLLQLLKVTSKPIYCSGIYAGFIIIFGVLKSGDISN